MKTIGFTGYKGAGKDTAAQVLIAKGYQPQSFAAAMKAMLAALMLFQGATEEEIHRYLDGDWKNQPCPYLDGHTPRYAMQTLGTEWGRKKMSDRFWINTLARRIKLFVLNVITDVRFPNEEEYVREELGGPVVWINDEKDRDDLHESESYIQEIGDRAEHEIKNTGTIEDLHQRVREVFQLTT